MMDDDKATGGTRDCEPEPVEADAEPAQGPKRHLPEYDAYDLKLMDTMIGEGCPNDGRRS